MPRSPFKKFLTCSTKCTTFAESRHCHWFRFPTTWRANMGWLQYCQIIVSCLKNSPRSHGSPEVCSRPNEWMNSLWRSLEIPSQGSPILTKTAVSTFLGRFNNTSFVLLKHTFSIKWFKVWIAWRSPMLIPGIRCCCQIQSWFQGQILNKLIKLWTSFRRFWKGVPVRHSIWLASSFWMLAVFLAFGFRIILCRTNKISPCLQNSSGLVFCFTYCASSNTIRYHHMFRDSMVIWLLWRGLPLAPIISYVVRTTSEK